MATTIKPEQDRFPFCIVWTTIPCLSWLLPWIGHVGIGNSEGTVYDFLGKYINVGKMSFNSVKKYVVLENIDRQEYDRAILEANSKYCRLDHNLCCNNCHHHVADVLNILKFQGNEDWSQVSIWWMCLWRSKYVTYLDILCIYLPIVIVLGLIFGLVFGLA